jgi:hypothetical protein
VQNKRLKVTSLLLKDQCNVRVKQMSWLTLCRVDVLSLNQKSVLTLYVEVDRVAGAVAVSIERQAEVSSGVFTTNVLTSVLQ